VLQEGSPARRGNMGTSFPLADRLRLQQQAGTAKLIGDAADTVTPST